MASFWMISAWDSTRATCESNSAHSRLAASFSVRVFSSSFHQLAKSPLPTKANTSASRLEFIVLRGRRENEGVGDGDRVGGLEGEDPAADYRSDARGHHLVAQGVLLEVDLSRAARRQNRKSDHDLSFKAGVSLQLALVAPLHRFEPLADVPRQRLPIHVRAVHVRRRVPHLPGYPSIAFGSKIHVSAAAGPNLPDPCHRARLASLAQSALSQ